MSPEKRCCENCAYWNKYDDTVHPRVYVKVHYKLAEKLENAKYGGLVEARFCTYVAPPNVDDRCLDAYTFGTYSCSEFKNGRKFK